MVLPRLQLENKDPSSKEVYPDEVKALAKEFSVDYNTAKKAWDKVLRDAGQKPEAVKEVTSRVGDVNVRSVGRPKSLPPPEAEKQAQGAASQVPPEEKKRLATEAAAKLFAGMHKGTAEFLYNLAEAAWGVKILRPDVRDGKVIPITDEANPYFSAGSMWADVIDAYDIEMSKVLVLLMATVNTGQVIASPLVMARAEAGRLKKEKEEAERQAKEKEKQPTTAGAPGA